MLTVLKKGEKIKHGLKIKLIVILVQQGLPLWVEIKSNFMLRGDQAHIWSSDIQ